MAAVEAQGRSEAQGHGLTGVPQIDWSSLMATKRAYTEKIPTGTQDGLQSAGIANYHGEASFEADGHLTVGDTNCQRRISLSQRDKLHVFPILRDRNGCVPVMISWT
ncbi:hypothetical protein L3X07_07000 [Levilactobacillus brevis]|nr:hypothetical protein [Levilactobacillus brevis]